MFTISPQWLLQRLGLEGAVDPDTAEMATMLLMRFQNAEDKQEFVKKAIRGALAGTAPAATFVSPGFGKLPRKRS
jgi:hypothetical protein